MTTSCKDCLRDGTVTNRKAPYAGPRCYSHNRIRKSQSRDTAWERRLMSIYGISAEEYWKIYEFQKGRCYICGRGKGARKRLAVDHDHSTGIIRGLLDQPCNRNVLGHLRDSPEALQRAIDYLTNPPAQEVIGCRIVPLTGAPVRGSTQQQAGAKRTTTEIGVEDL